MHFVYLLRSAKDGGFYIGRSDNLERRLVAHNEGQVDSTRSRRPFELLYFEAYTTPDAASNRELKLKQFGSAYKGLLKRLGF